MSPVIYVKNINPYIVSNMINSHYSIIVISTSFVFHHSHFLKSEDAHFQTADLNPYVVLQHQMLLDCSKG